MAGCRIVNASMTAAKTDIDNISNEYTNAGSDFITNFNSAISEMEGETKDALEKFIKDNVQPLVEKSIPEAVTGMGKLLEANRENFEKTDKAIAESIAG
ncbi:MAG: hypothetical protein LBD25_02030 [Coriobacteriales bacterium]|jgi:hypothetical protein|nr:hypothetical protein [Coriobacteriales bacterium]